MKTRHTYQVAPQTQALVDQYLNDIQNKKITPNTHQMEIINEFQTLYNYLTHIAPTQDLTFLDKLIAPFKKLNHSHLKPSNKHHNRGLYIWGDVGRGKTFIANYFFKNLPIENKLRLHFYRFMQLVHEELSTFKNVADPLRIVADRLLKQTTLLYLDEFIVNDITDAMLLSKLFEHLFTNGMVLVTTSNTPPYALYKDGLQREKFIPTIKLLERYTKTIKLEGEIDYRLKILEKTGLYHITHGHDDALLEQRMDNYFQKLSGVQLHKDRTDIIINKRRIPVKKWADNVVWFEFDDLCNSPRSTADYTQIAQFFTTVLISNIPIMDSSMDDAARRFVIMIDEFYDSHTKLVITAAAEPEELYTSSKLEFEFKRTSSRLREMQSNEYMASH